jgi:hypothetical protein
MWKSKSLPSDLLWSLSLVLPSTWPIAQVAALGFPELPESEQAIDARQRAETPAQG